jgi:hypothetical protein
VPAFAQSPATVQALAARVEALEAQEAIRQLWADYGRTLDARDFAAFSTLWAREATYGGTPGAPGAKGPAAIGAFLEKAIGSNYPDSKGKNFHLYFNESIDVKGDRATAWSRGGFVMASADNTKADFLLLAISGRAERGRPVEVPLRVIPARFRSHGPPGSRPGLSTCAASRGEPAMPATILLFVRPRPAPGRVITRRGSSRPPRLTDGPPRRCAHLAHSGRARPLYPSYRPHPSYR